MSNSIWKTPDIKPDGQDTYIAITTDGLICAFVSPKMCDNSVDRWAYLTDIITQADKAERLQKAVDLALDGLEYADKALTGGTVGWETQAQKVIKEIKQMIKDKTDVG